MISKDAGLLLFLVTNKTSRFSCLNFIDSKTSFSCWNFDSSLVGQKVFHAGNLLILVLDKTRVFMLECY